MNRNSVSRALAIAACVGILAACGSDDDTQAQGYEATPGAPQSQRGGEYGGPPTQDDQARQQDRSTASDQAAQQRASGQGGDDGMRDTEGQEIPSASAVEFRE